MEGGNLRHRVAIQRRDTTLDVFGQQVQTWITLFTVWGMAEDISGREFVAAMAINSLATTHIMIRYRAGITAADRVLYDGVIYNITAPPIDPTGRKRELHLMCSRGINNG